MKKFLGLLLICMICLTLVACKKDVKEDVYDEDLANENIVTDYEELDDEENLEEFGEEDSEEVIEEAE